MTTLVEAYAAVVQNAAMFRMAASLVDLRACARPIEVPPILPPSQRGEIWNPLVREACRMKLLNDTASALAPKHRSILERELPKIWARRVPGGRKWLFFHPSLTRESTIRVFEALDDSIASVRRGDGLVESVDNLVFGLLYVHGVPVDQWPGRRKGSKRKMGAPNRSTR
jgi:hypothetical protein